MVIVRDAAVDDMIGVCELYNALIDETTVVWSETRELLSTRISWFERQGDDGNPVLVADDNGEVVGFASYGSFRGEGKWPGYRFTVEHTVHVRRDRWGGGVGRALMETLMGRAGDQGLHVMVGAIDGDNQASIRFHERIGFVEVGRMPQVGQKFGRWLDLVLVHRLIEP